MSEPQEKAESRDNIVRIRGLPWQATKDDIVNFFSDCKIKGGLDGVKMTLSHQGRPSGEAYVEFEDGTDFEKALECHKKHIGSRYIEVFSSDRQQMLMSLQRSGIDSTSEGPDKQASYVRIRGLPFGSRSEDIIKFFTGMEITRDGIVFSLDNAGRQTGEAYIKFASVSTADKALSKHKERIGHRYIEVFKSSPQEFRNIKSLNSDHYIYETIGKKYTPPFNPSPQDSYPSKMPNSRWLPTAFNRPSPYDRYARPAANQRYMSAPTVPSPQIHAPLASSAASLTPIGASRRPDASWNLSSSSNSLPGSTPTTRPYNFNSDVSGSPTFSTPRHLVHMRGLPYNATEDDITDFFLPLIPSRVIILFDDSGRPSGEADVEFRTHLEATKAMNKDKANMRHRYIELFLHSAPENIRSRLGPPLTQNVTPMSTPVPQLMQGLSCDSTNLSTYSLRSLQLQPTQNSSLYFPSNLNSGASNYLIPSMPSITSNLSNATYSTNPVYRTNDGVLRSRI